MFKTRCPVCNAEGTLAVISGIFTAFGMMLSEDGFSFGDAKNVDTEGERIECQACKNYFSLAALMCD